MEEKIMSGRADSGPEMSIEETLKELENIIEKMEDRNST